MQNSFLVIPPIAFLICFSVLTVLAHFLSGNGKTAEAKTGNADLSGVEYLFPLAALFACILMAGLVLGLWITISAPASLFVTAIFTATISLAVAAFFLG